MLYAPKFYGRTVVFLRHAGFCAPVTPKRLLGILGILRILGLLRGGLRVGDRLDQAERLVRKALAEGDAGVLALGNVEQGNQREDQQDQPDNAAHETDHRGDDGAKNGNAVQELEQTEHRREQRVAEGEQKGLHHLAGQPLILLHQDDKPQQHCAQRRLAEDGEDESDNGVKTQTDTETILPHDDSSL